MCGIGCSSSSCCGGVVVYVVGDAVVWCGGARAKDSSGGL